jgi:RNA polymerase sigma-70 factor (ECF subfamily)
MRAATASDWDHLCTTMRPRLNTVARSVLRDEHEAEDATQDALFAAWRNAGSVRDPGAIERWMIGVARNVALDRLRALMRHRRVGELPAIDIGQCRMPQPDERLEFSDMIDSLSAVTRRTVRHEMRGLSVSAIALKEGVSPAAVKTRRTRARAQVREALCSSRT